MKRPHPEAHHLGYTLTEVILAMAVMAISVPLILGLVVAGGEASRQAERETRAVMTARTVFEELRRTRDGNSEFIEESDLPWAANAAEDLIDGGGSSSGGTSDDWLIFELNSDGDILGKAENMGYEGRWTGEGNEVVGLAAVRGYSQEIENVELVDGEPLSVFLIEVRVESPARAEAENRNRSSFIKSDSLR